jgi:hypothetical protein
MSSGEHVSQRERQYGQAIAHNTCRAAIVNCCGGRRKLEPPRGPGDTGHET